MIETTPSDPAPIEVEMVTIDGKPAGTLVRRNGEYSYEWAGLRGKGLTKEAAYLDAIAGGRQTIGFIQAHIEVLEKAMEG